MRTPTFIVAALAALTPANAATLADYGAGASCLIAPNHSYKLAMATPGALAKVAVERADHVKKGDLIAQLESGVEQAQLEAARARADTDCKSA